jgi:SEC-C motif-containing protein
MPAPQLALGSSCPCGNLRAYAECCGRFHAGEIPDTAPQLMRSRYSAYVLRLTDYLLATWHPDTRPEALALPPPEELRWVGLDIRSQRLGGNGRRARVEFIARFREGGGSRVQAQHEVSRFVREDGRWFYVDGEFPAPPTPFTHRPAARA